MVYINISYYEENKIYITYCEYWAIIIFVFGGLGNIITILAILHQFFLQKQRKISFIKLNIREICERKIKNYIEFNIKHISSISKYVQEPGSTRKPEKTYKKKKVFIFIRPDSLILLHLSFCDLLYCLVNLPLTIYTYRVIARTINENCLNGTCNVGYIYINDNNFSFCTIFSYLRYLIAYVEWITLALLFFERCIDLMRFKSAKVFTITRTLFSLLFVWIVSISLHINSLIKVKLEQNLLNTFTALR